MIFNSIDFAIFLPIVFILHWALQKYALRWQNILIVFASYLFYGWWDWRFLVLIILSTIVDYFIGVSLGKTTDEKRRKYLLWTSLAVNLGILGFFKYYNFFLDNFITAFQFFGTDITYSSIKIILPVGISFYTFQTLSYSIDVYKKKLKPTHDFIAFSAFVSFFPQLVAGPIERAVHLLPQFYNKRTFDYAKAVDGLRQILWGLFKKIVIADNAAQIVNDVFTYYDQYPSSTLIMGAIFFSLQIYCDFSGYSDIAIGTSRLFGFDLMQNFNFPYFSRDIAEFWRRWHISLSTWFRDYLYIPLGGSKGGIAMKVRNTCIIFLVSGFWHGANWTFIAWGAINALLFLPLLIRNRNRTFTDTVAHGRILPSLKEVFQLSLTFVLVTLGWIFFRSDTISDALAYIARIVTQEFWVVPHTNLSGDFVIHVFAAVFFFVYIEWIGRGGKFALEKLGLYWSKLARRSLYILVCFFIFLFFGKDQAFIYFQF